MFRKILGAAMVLLAAALAQPAEAADRRSGNHDDPFQIWKPYVIEKDCTYGHDRCRARMDYAPHQHAMVVRPGSYWYQKPFLVHSYGDYRYHRLYHRRPHHHHGHHHHGYHHHHGHHHGKHVAWCSGRYRTYDPETDTFVGKGHRRYRCNSPYDRY